MQRGPGAAENNYFNAQRNLAGIDYGNRAITDVTQRLAGAGNTLDYFRSDPFQGTIRDNPVDQEYGYFSEGLRGPSYSEQIYETGAGGLIDPYARAQEKQTRQIRNAAAARGMFNTGASMRLEEELAADIGAAEARDRIALADQADRQRLARTGAAQSFIGSVAGEGRARAGLGLEGARASDESERQNALAALQAYQLASQEGLGKVGLETSAAQIAQQNEIDRLFKSGQLGLDADRGDLARIDTMFRGAGQLDERERLADLEETDRRREQTERFRTGADIGLSIDKDEQERLLNEATAAYHQQSVFQDRERGGLQDILTAMRPQIDAVMAGLDTASREQLQIKLMEIQALVSSGALTQMQANQQIETILTSFATMIRARGA